MDYDNGITKKGERLSIRAPRQHGAVRRGPCGIIKPRALCTFLLHPIIFLIWSLSTAPCELYYGAEHFSLS